MNKVDSILVPELDQIFKESYKSNTRKQEVFTYTENGDKAR
jgi:hypothetical protein